MLLIRKITKMCRVMAVARREIQSCRFSTQHSVCVLKPEAEPVDFTAWGQETTTFSMPLFWSLPKLSKMLWGAQLKLKSPFRMWMRKKPSPSIKHQKKWAICNQQLESGPMMPQPKVLQMALLSVRSSARFWWLKDREAQEQFEAVWEASIHNLADYPTKHHLSPHHEKARPVHLHEGDRSPTNLQGCDKKSSNG